MDEAEVETAEIGASTRSRVGVVVLTLLVVALVGYLIVPRTVASGGQGDAAWSLRVAPVGLDLGPSVRLHQRDRGVVATVGGAHRPRDLAGSALLHVGEGGDAETLAVGPVPSDAASVRVTTDERGVGEAELVRVAWVRFHLARLPGGVQTAELVAISPGGAVVDVDTVTSADVTG